MKKIFKEGLFFDFLLDNHIYKETNKKSKKEYLWAASKTPEGVKLIPLGREDGIAKIPNDEIINLEVVTIEDIGHIDSYPELFL